MIAIRGINSAIARELINLMPESERVLPVPRLAAMPLNYDRYFFCAGLLQAKPLRDQSAEETAESWRVNYSGVAQECRRIIGTNDKARICVMGSESGFAGSFDETYADAKSALHDFVARTRLRTPQQQLIAIAPSIVENAGMTTRRLDRDNLDRRRERHPKQRFLTAAEVARLVHFVLYVDDGYLTGTVVRMNGGQHTAQ